MREEIIVGCPYCRWTNRCDRRRLERDGLIACQSCRSLVSASKAEATGKEIEKRRMAAVAVS